MQLSTHHRRWLHVADKRHYYHWTTTVLSTVVLSTMIANTRPWSVSFAPRRAHIVVVVVVGACRSFIRRPLGSRSTATCTRSWVRRTKLWVREGGGDMHACMSTYTHTYVPVHGRFPAPLSDPPSPSRKRRHTRALLQSETPTCPLAAGYCYC